MNYISNESVAQPQVASYDVGLRNFMLQVYNYMTVALALSGMTALGVYMVPALSAAIWGTGLKWVVVFLPLVLSFGFAFLFDKMSLQMAKIALLVFAVAMGLSLSSIFLIYKMGSIAQVFFISAATFGGASLYGYTTKKDLTSFGSFLIMGVIGLVIAGVVNLFLQSSMFAFAISCIAVLVFTGLTAYDTQNLKNTYEFTVCNDDEQEKLGIYGALQLYLDFINIFVSLLQLLGDRKND
jgi:FtsH-binding integral membrane protein